MPSGCGEFEGEVLVSDDGIYLGDFAHGRGLDTALGWSRSESIAWGLYNPYCPPGQTFQCCGLVDWIMSPFWEPPYVTAGCGGAQPLVPLGHLGTGYTGLLDGEIVVDSTGPPHLESLPAVEFSLSGIGTGSVAFVGEQASNTSGFEPEDYDPGWNPDASSRWVFQAWLKMVPDFFDYEMPQARVKFGYGRLGTSAVLAHEAEGELTSEWQFFQVHFSILPWLFMDHPAIPFIQVSDLDEDGNLISYRRSQEIILYCKRIIMSKYEQHGRFRMKCAHLYPEDAPQLGVGNWCDSFHGHG